MERNVTMPTLESVKNFKAAMASEQGAFGPFMITSDPAFVEAAGYAGYDFVLLDMEHGPGTFENLQNLIRAANVSGVCPVVRVPRGTDIWIDQARAAVSAAKFSPRGTRGTCRFVRSAAYGGVPGADYFAKAQDTVVILQAEGQKAIDNLDDILSVEGVDIVFVGPYDLSASLGIIGQITHPLVMDRIAQIVQKAAAKGVQVGCFADSAESGRKLLEMGVKFIGYSCDTAIFMNMAKADIAAFHGEH